MATATWNGTVIAQSDETVQVEGNHYFPPHDVDLTRLRPSDTTTVCPWKGTASYFDIVVDDAINPSAAWHYPNPSPAASDIAGYIAFWNGVDVT
ncbi:MAG: DUF427 domain-containing protein [Nitriliruptoraceae bacterium]